MKLWLLDADIIIDFLAAGIFDQLVTLHEVHVAETVATEVKYYKIRGNRVDFDFVTEYVKSGKVKILAATSASVRNAHSKLPIDIFDGMDAGEQESLAVLLENESLSFCTGDKFAIMALPFLDCEERGISAEELLRKSGMTYKRLEDKHTERYFNQWLSKGKERKIYSVRH